jgi:hypothetical protein
MVVLMIKCNTLNCPTHASLIRDSRYYCSSCYRVMFDHEWEPKAEPQYFNKAKPKIRRKVLNPGKE